MGLYSGSVPRKRERGARPEGPTLGLTGNRDPSCQGTDVYSVPRRA